MAKKSNSKSNSRNTRVEQSSSPAPVAPPKRLFPIVGVGASAGGLEAFSSLLSHLPASTSMAFVFVQHLDPSHSSGLDEILGRTTKIPVTQATDGVVVEPGHIYVIPANADMLIRDGALLLSPRTLSRGQHRPIDHFLRSLADDRGDQSIAVILSGTASDGTAGAGAIKSVGGITFAQDEASAKYASMPRNAINSGSIDFVLPPPDIAKELVRIEKHPYVVRAHHSADERLAIGSPSVLQTLFAMLRDTKDVDFTHYKQTTLQRRIKRRMVLNNIEKIEDYVRFVKGSPAELDELYRDVLIHVTAFFRDPGAFEALRKHVFPQILDKPNSAPLRVWVPGCSTGEEAYSLAITVLEYLWNDSKGGRGHAAPPIQIFATDVSEDALDRARAGIYLESSLLDVSSARLKRFFVQIDGGYQINKAVRDLCIFARQNAVKDPPFSNLDLITCRNLLIYLGPELQKRLIPALHYGLKPSGYLMLGSAESLGAFSDHFTLIEKRNRIYQKKQTSARLITYFTGVDQSLRRGGEQRLTRTVPAMVGVDKEVERVLVNRFIPPAIVVNSEMEIIQFRGKTGAYLEPASGNPTFSLSKMAREGLLVDLRSALQMAKKENTVVRKERVSVRTNGGHRLVNLEVIPISSDDSRERYFTVVFQDAPKEPAAEKSRGKTGREDKALPRLNERLQREAQGLREQLQALIEDNQTTSEEFKTANEEVLSANEELQSTNEELETAKEELQSSNEELTTLNEELQNRNTELSMTNNDLINLLGNVNIPVVMVTNEIRIRRFTPPAQKLLNLISGDVGRRLGEVRTNLKIDDLERIARETIDSSTMQEIEVQDNNGAWCVLRSRPYKTWDNRIDGAVISFQDIDALKRVLESSKAYADALIQNARESILVLDHRLCVVVANPAFYNAFRVTPQETLTRRVYELGNHQWDIPKLRELLDVITTENTRIDDFMVVHNFEHIGERTMMLNARRIEPQRGQFLIFLSIEDVSALKQSEANLRRLSNYLMTLQDEERRRLARELHDSTGQKLAAAKMNLDSLVKNPDHKNQPKLISEAAEWLDEAFQDVRTVSQLLHPPMLDEAGLVTAARWLADGFSKRSKIQVDVQVADGLGRLDSAVELALFRVIQEALSNVHRHSGAKKAEIALTHTPTEVTLEIRDNGKGIPKNVLTGGKGESRLGVGILGMRERLAQLGGTLEINSGKSGTTVRASIPASATKSTPASA